MAEIIKELDKEPNVFSDKVNETLEKMVKELENGNYDKCDDGYSTLMDDLAQLFSEAFHYEFHDFRNKKYETPKVELRNRLLELAQNVVDGKYDS